MLLLATMAFGQAKEDAGDGKMLDKQTMEFKDYLPEIHGTIRGKYEYQTETSESRFEVRNARFSVSGNVHPIVAYKAEIDLSDEGSIKMLDAYARVFPVKDLNFTIGQMRVPFTIDAHRSPHQQYFANRSFIAKQVGNVRDVGLTAGYTNKKGIQQRIDFAIVYYRQDSRAHTWPGMASGMRIACFRTTSLFAPSRPGRTNG